MHGRPELGGGRAYTPVGVEVWNAMHAVDCQQAPNGNKGVCLHIDAGGQSC